MAADEYRSIPSTGKLKLKGVSDGRVDKKKKKKKRAKTEEDPQAKDDANAKFEQDNSVVLKSLEDEDREIVKSMEQDGAKVHNDSDNKAETREDVKQHLQTEAEKRFDEQRRKRLEERLKREGVKTHKQRVEELNRYLSRLSEHHDMPKIGPG